MDQTKLQIWMYKLLMGKLSPKKTEQLRLILGTRMRSRSNADPLEKIIFKGLTIKRPFKRTVNQELKEWEASL